MRYDFGKSMAKIIRLTKIGVLVGQSFGISVFALFISVFYGDFLRDSRLPIIAFSIISGIILITLVIYLDILLKRATDEHQQRVHELTADTSHRM